MVRCGRRLLIGVFSERCHKVVSQRYLQKAPLSAGEQRLSTPNPETRVHPHLSGGEPTGFAQAI